MCIVRGEGFEDLDDWEVITGCHQNRNSVLRMETSVFFSWLAQYPAIFCVNVYHVILHRMHDTYPWGAKCESTEQALMVDLKGLSTGMTQSRLHCNITAVHSYLHMYALWHTVNYYKCKQHVPSNALTLWTVAKSYSYIHVLYVIQWCCSNSQLTLQNITTHISWPEWQYPVLLAVYTQQCSSKHTTVQQ